MGLHLWESDDQVLRTEFNQNWQKLDTAVAAVQDDLTDGLAAAAQDLADAVGSGGHTCRIAHGSYVGTGAAGSGSPNSLTFDFSPKVLFIASTRNGYNPIFMVNGGFATGYCQQIWSGNSVTWYDNRGNGYATAAEQQNDYGITYYYVAIGY